MSKIFKILLGEKGAIFLENTVALPLFFSMLFVFQDAVVISFNWLALQNAVHEGVRRGVITDLTLTTDTAKRKQDAINQVIDMMRSYGVYTNENFQIKNSDLYNEVEDEDGDPITINAYACAQEGKNGSWDCCNNSRRSLFGDTIYIEAKKVIKVTPISGLLLSLSNQSDTITITAFSRGYIEPLNVDYDYSEDATWCGGSSGYGCFNPSDTNSNPWNGCLDGPSTLGSCDSFGADNNLDGIRECWDPLVKAGAS